MCQWKSYHELLKTQSFGRRYKQRSQRDVNLAFQLMIVNTIGTDDGFTHHSPHELCMKQGKNYL